MKEIPNKRTCKFSNGTEAASPRSPGDGRFDGYFIFFSLFLFRWSCSKLQKDGERR
jgi:hypothetical protein